MIYCIDETSSEPIMLINTHVGQDESDGMGIDGALFQKELLYLDTLGKKRIQIWINSVGGNVMDGYNIGATILKTNTPVDTYNVGISASIAGVIFMCGRNRFMFDYALLMMHKPNGGTDSVMLNTMQESLATMLGAKSNLTPETISELMNSTTWLNAGKCLEKGLCTEIESTEQSNEFKGTVLNYTDVFKQANKITNSLLKIKNEKSMLKVTMKLGLSDNADEANILKAIEAIENKSTAEREAMQKEIDDAENALKDLKEKFNALELEVEADKEADTAEKAKNMITGFATAGRIKNEIEVVAKWEALAVADLEGTKELIENLPINIVANQIEVTDAIVGAKNPNDFMSQAMKEIRNKTTKN